ncbi:energy-coupling factor transporter transmembrane protein EcfT [Erysipelotrichaceae bacterium Oil+RF-744-GAM-WT-6]|uniref:Energy-coupling factor transporter transmembrane protein EcfT n=1 Tax=Stecheria intestinalis TaxID=2606630 RepID=A0A7X2NRQ5_9FIRM|nr:energy-coupling factor transporter transmembrane component T [Stecheria intestinalis]MSS58299.1 energy-coupling factor transporter transmembrane protein EcfT [Stecheria intestinalis]
MNNRLFINLHPGTTYIDKLTGKTKVRLFLLFIVILIATWDLRIILPLFVLFLIALLSLHPSWKRIRPLVIFVVAVNLLNLFLMWLVEPDYGLQMVGGSTILFRFNSYAIVTRETMWYFLVRFMKFMATFLVSLVFIQSITPSELAAGLYSIRMPYKGCFIVELAFRYIPDIARDFSNIKISMQARGMELDSRKTKLSTRLKQNVLILAPLIITSFDRVGNIANAMDLRGFGKGKTRTYYSEHEDTPGDRQMRIVILFQIVLFVLLVIHNIRFGSDLIWSPWY